MTTQTPKKILITGGAGFIGSHVADAYLTAGHQVTIVDNLSTGKGNYIPKGAKFIQADITDRKQIAEIFQAEQPQVINLHAAHIQVGYSVTHPQFDAEQNILGLLNIMEAAKESRVERVIFASTGGAMYGDQPTPFNEEMHEQPLAPYGISKRASELYLHFYYTTYHIPYCVLRYANVYGERQNPHGESGVIAIFMEMIHAGKKPIINGDGTHTRDYVYVGDVAQANLLTLESTFVGILNIGTGREVSTNHIFHLVTEAMQQHVPEEHGPERPGEQITSSLDSSRAKEILGWLPTVALEDGVQRVAQWYAHYASL